MANSQHSGADIQGSQVKAQSEATIMHGVKIEKVAENNAARAKANRKDWKKGMEVGLTSPNSLQVVAYGTVQNLDKESKCFDGKPLSDCIEVLVNYVLKETTLLPRAQGRITRLGSATAQCIPWPVKNVSYLTYYICLFHQTVGYEHADVWPIYNC